MGHYLREELEQNGYEVIGLDLSPGDVAVNRAGRDHEQFLHGNLGKC